MSALPRAEVPPTRERHLRKIMCCLLFQVGGVGAGDGALARGARRRGPTANWDGGKKPAPTLTS